MIARIVGRACHLGAMVDPEFRILLAETNRPIAINQTFEAKQCQECLIERRACRQIADRHEDVINHMGFLLRLGFDRRVLRPVTHGRQFAKPSLPCRTKYIRYFLSNDPIEGDAEQADEAPTERSKGGGTYGAACFTGVLMYMPARL